MQFHPLVRHITRGETTSGLAIDGAVGLLVDISAGLHHEHLKVPTTQQAIQPDANHGLATGAAEFKKQFLAVMSHNIRTPVVGVITMAELLLGDDKLRAAQRSLARNIHRSAKALLALVNDLLDFSQTDSDTVDIETIPFRPLPILRDITEGLEYFAELKGLAFSAHIATDIESDFKVMGDPGRLRHVLACLLANSFDVDQGSVTFSARKDSEDSKTTTLKFVIEDTRRVEQDLVRDPQGDSPTSKRCGRTQHGLSISKSVVELMKGRIQLDSRPAVGTTTTIWIPFEKTPCQRAFGSGQTSLSANLANLNLSRRRSSVETTPPERSRSAWRRSSNGHLLAMMKPAEMLPFSQRGSILVLVAEDNPINQQFALIAIKKLGFQAVAVSDGQEALFYLTAAMEGKTTKPRVIVMDIQMPIVDGYMCARILRNDEPFKSYVDDVPIVALTASAVQGDKEKCKSAGMDDYMSKPITINTLERVLVRWSTQSRPGASRNGDCAVVEEDSDEEGQGPVASEGGVAQGEGSCP